MVRLVRTENTNGEVEFTERKNVSGREKVIYVEDLSIQNICCQQCQENWCTHLQHSFRLIQY